MKKEGTTEEKAANERKLAKELEAKEAEKKRKQLDKQRRRIKEANELFKRATVSKDKHGSEVIIRPH